MAAVGGSGTTTIHDMLVQHPDQAHVAVWQAVLAAAGRRGERPPAPDGSAARLVLIIDQFEQVFTLSTGPEAQAARRAFVTALCAAATNRAAPRQGAPSFTAFLPTAHTC